MATVWQDIRHGLRVLKRSPGSTAAIVVILALGIGTTTAMLSAVDAVLLRPCPYEDPSRLVCVYESKDPERIDHSFTSRARFADWRRQQHAFEQMVGADQWNGIVRVADRAEQSRGFFVSEGFFSLLGAKPILGRTFLPQEHAAVGQRVVVLSYDYWRRWFAGDQDILGKTMWLDNQMYTVVGVLSKDFRWVFQCVNCGLWMPLPREDSVEDGRRGLQVIARLPTGVSLGQAQAQMDVIAGRMAQASPETTTDYGIQIVPINEDYARRTAGFGKPRMLLILLGVAGAVLLLACIHAANLLIARAAVREPEIAVRAALGARPIRIVRQLLTESILLALGSGLFALLLAHLGIQVLSLVRTRSIPWYIGADTEGAIPWFVQVHLDARALLYVLGLSLLTCLLFGTLPALWAAHVNVSQRLSVARTRTMGTRFQSLRAALVIADLAIAFVLLAGAGLLINSYLRISHVDRQFNPRHVLVAEIAFDWHQQPDPIRRLTILQEALRRTRELPGVQAVTAANYGPVSGSYSTLSFQMEGHLSVGTGVALPQTEVFPDYFHLLQIPILQGRCFTEHDDRTTAPVAVINEATARRFWPNESAIGKHIVRVGRPNAAPVTYEIVGVVANVWHSRYTADEPEVYTPYPQSDYSPEIQLMIRTSSDPIVLMAAARRELAASVEGAAVNRVVSMEELIANSFSSQRLNAQFFSVFAAAALLLASIGIYGTMAYTVSWRTREIGIRMALGARNVDILRLVVGQGLKLILLGTGIGAAGALALRRVIASLLYNVSPTDPLTFALVSLALTSVALAASYLPARRAVRIAPMMALRDE